MKTIFKFFIILGFILAFPCVHLYSQISINSDMSVPDASAMLDVKSTSAGMLIPRMTVNQRTAISSPAEGLLVFQTDGTAGFYYHNGPDWKFLGFGSGDRYSGNVIDMDGNVYATTRIGTQEWMAENLRVTHYRNGDAIPRYTNNFAWHFPGGGAYCWYNNNEASFKLLYGALYNWFAVTDSRNICPNGWHVPSDAEFTVLTNYLGGLSTAGGKMKSDINWTFPNTGATNSSSFSAQSGGVRYISGVFSYAGGYGYYWSTTPDVTGYAWHLGLNYTEQVLYRYSGQQEDGLSVRCLRDN